MAALRTLLEVVEIIDAEFRLAGPGLRLTAHPLLFAAQSVAHTRQLSRHCLDTLGTPAQVHVEIAFDHKCLAIIEFDNLGAYAVKEITVVCNHEQGRLRPLQICLEPLDSGDIEVVGRFVENKEVGLGHDKARNGKTFALAARQFIDRRIKIGKAKPRKQLAQTVFIIPGHELVHLVIGFVCTRLVTGSYGISIGEYGSSTGVAVIVECGLIDSRAVEHRLLRQIADADIVAEGHSAAIRLLDTGYNAQHRGFARAVTGNDTNLVALVNTKSYITKEQPVAIALG